MTENLDTCLARYRADSKGSYAPAVGLRAEIRTAAASHYVSPQPRSGVFSMRQQVLRWTAAILVSFAFSGPVSASLIGDEIGVRISIPNQGGFNEYGTTVVAADATDAFTLTSGFNFFSFNIDPFDSGVNITLARCSGIFGCGGIVLDSNSYIEFSILQWIGQPEMIVGANLGAGTFNPNVTFSNASDSVRLDLVSQVTWPVTKTLILEVQTQQVPEPTTLALLSLGLACVGFARRRKLS